MGTGAGCDAGSDKDTSGAARTPIVAVSVPPLADFVERLAGDRVHLEVMLPAGANPTTYEPSMVQMRAMQRAALYVKVGHPNFAFERAWLQGLLKSAPQLPVVDCAAAADAKTGDPHIWLSPAAVLRMLPAIAAGLKNVLPAHAAAIARRRADFARRVRALDRHIGHELGQAATQRIVVFHPAWGYFAEHYGLEQVAIETQGKRPSAAQLDAIARQLQHSQTQQIVVQPQFSGQSAALIAKRIGARVRSLNPLSRDWVGTMKRAAAVFTGRSPARRHAEP